MILASKFMKMKCFSKQPQFIYTFSGRLSVLVLSLCASFSNAELPFEEPQGEMIRFRESGLGGAIAEVACESGDPKLQSAVLLQYTDEKPQYIYGDDGSKTCIGGSCLKARPETGQQRTSCVPKKTDVKWFGSVDVRDDPKSNHSYLQPIEEAAYSGVGRVACIAWKQKFDESKRPILDASGTPVLEQVENRSTAFHVGSFDTMVTNAHALVQDSIDPVSKKVVEIKVPTKNCSAVFYNAEGIEVDRVSIHSSYSRWDNPDLNGDRSNDIAILKLVRESATPTNALLHDTSYSGKQLDGVRVSVVGFHGDVSNNKKIRKTSGLVYSASAGFNAELFARREGLPFKNRANVIIGDYASNHGTSGSPILDTKGNVIGIHQGHSDLKNSDGTSNRQFNKQNNYNMGILFDEQFHRDLERIKLIKPSNII
jgi:hypothetical protein